MKLIKVTWKKKIYYAKVDDEDYDELSKYKWYLIKGYVRRNRKKSDINAPRLISMHREVLKFPNAEVDHKDNNKLNCQKLNLRLATSQQNSTNCLKTTRNTKSKYKGVTFDVRSNKWRSRITINGKRINLLTTSSEITAAKEYNEAAIKYFGEFANLNVIE